jgi:hypothetical protein
MLAISTGLQVTSAGGAFLSGNDLYGRLKDYTSGAVRNVTSASSGFGFVIGVSDVMDGKLDPSTGYKFCLPNQVTAGQLTDVTIRFLEKKPELRHLSAYSLVENALADSFPCP